MTAEAVANARLPWDFCGDFTGDVDADSLDDGVVLIDCVFGNTPFTLLAVVLGGDGRFTLPDLDDAFVDLPGSAAISAARIDGSEVLVDIAYYRDGEGACCPSGALTARLDYSSGGGEIVGVEFVS